MTLSDKPLNPAESEGAASPLRRRARPRDKKPIFKRSKRALTSRNQRVMVGNEPLFLSDPQIRSKLIAGLQLGLPMTTCADMCRLGKATIVNWMNTAHKIYQTHEQFKANGRWEEYCAERTEPELEREEAYVKLLLDARGAHAEFSVRHMRNITDAAEGTVRDADGRVIPGQLNRKHWSASLVLLERRRGSLFGPVFPRSPEGQRDESPDPPIAEVANVVYDVLVRFFLKEVSAEVFAEAVQALQEGLDKLCKKVAESRDAFESELSEIAQGTTSTDLGSASEPGSFSSATSRKRRSKISRKGGEG